MENSVTAAPLLVRKGIRYTKLAVTRAETGSKEDQRGAVLHLGTGEETGRERGGEEGTQDELKLSVQIDIVLT